MTTSDGDYITAIFKRSEAYQLGFGVGLVDDLYRYRKWLPRFDSSLTEANLDLQSVVSGRSGLLQSHSRDKERRCLGLLRGRVAVKKEGEYGEIREASLAQSVPVHRRIVTGNYFIRDKTIMPNSSGGIITLLRHRSYGCLPSQIMFNATAIRLVASLVLVAAPTTPVRAQSASKELARGNADWDAKNYKSAETHFDRALRASHGAPSIGAGAFYGRGVARLELHKWNTAKEDLTHAIELDPTNAGAFASRGMARKGLGGYNGLLLDAREAARLNPTQFASFEDDAKSTVLWRRMMMVFLGLAGIVLCVGGWAFGRVLVRIMRAERDANRAAN